MPISFFSIFSEHIPYITGLQWSDMFFFQLYPFMLWHKFYNVWLYGINAELIVTHVFFCSLIGQIFIYS